MNTIAGASGGPAARLSGVLWVSGAAIGPDRIATVCVSASMAGPMFDGEQRGLGPTGKAELGEDVRDMRPRRPLGHPQLVGDRPVREASGEAVEDVPFACRQLADARRGSAWRDGGRTGPVTSHPSGDDPGDGGVEDHLPGVGGPDRSGEVVRFGVLEEKAARAGFDRGGDAILLDKAGDGHDFDLGMSLLDLGGCGDAVHPGHQEIHHDHIGEERVDLVERSETVRRFTDDFEIVVQPEEIAHAATDHRVVVDDQDADRHGQPRAPSGSGGRSAPSAAGASSAPSPRSPSMAGAATTRPARSSPPADRWRITAAVRIASPPVTWSGVRPSSSSHAARITPTTGSNSIRIPARVPPITRMPVRNMIDGIAAANSPLTSSRGSTDGSRSG